VTNRHRARTAKRHATLIGEAFFKIGPWSLFVMTGAQLPIQTLDLPVTRHSHFRATDTPGP
jgi:hypothetical protein